MKRKEIIILGMKCEGCLNRISNVLSNIKGIISYNISLEDGKADIVFKKEKHLDEAISKIESLGFKVN